MTKLNKWFNRSEFRCKCGLCSTDTIDYELIHKLTLLRKHYNKPVIINSGIRCVKHNIDIGSNMRSQHLRGKAADFVVKGVSTEEVVAYLMKRYPNKHGIGAYKTFIHFDVREKKARW